MPYNPSLSITLSNSYTETLVDYEFIDILTGPGVHFSFDGSPVPLFEKRIAGFLDTIVLDIPVLKHLRLTIQSKNTFPHSAGIASSASAFSSIALCLCSIEEKLTGESVSGNYDFFRKASYLSRLGSGSACRSIYGGYVIWGDSGECEDASNLFAHPYPFEVHSEFSDIRDTILIVSSAKKEMSSSFGHDLMKTHPYAFARYDQAREHTSELIKVLQTGDMEQFIAITENEALSLHGLMMSSMGGSILLKPETLSIISKICAYRKQTGVPVCFTLDAGPNVHVLYPNKYSEKIQKFIAEQLMEHCEEGKIIDDGIGKGPELILN